MRFYEQCLLIILLSTPDSVTGYTLLMANNLIATIIDRNGTPLMTANCQALAVNNSDPLEGPIDIDVERLLEGSPIPPMMRGFMKGLTLRIFLIKESS